MYQYLKSMLNLADQVGHVEEVEMGEWGKDTERIRITGTAKHGGTFQLELRNTEPEADHND